MWVPLHVHSQYSILDAAASVEAIAERSAQFGLPAVALTDHGNLFGAVEFYKACKEVKVKPILGCEFYVAPESRFDRKKDPSGHSAYHLGLLAKNKEGYHNLCKLSSIGYLEGYYYHPRIDYEVLKKHHAGLICLSGCLSSRIAYEILNGSAQSTLDQVRWFRDLFGEDFYIELQRHPMTPEAIHADGIEDEPWLYQQYQDYIAKQSRVNATLLEIAREQGLRIVATNDSHYIDREDWRAHEILLNVQSGEPCEILERDSYGNPKSRKANPKRRTYSSHELYFKSPQEMQALFHDLPEAISNTLEVADKCKVEIDFKTKHYPVYIPAHLEGKEFTAEEQAREAEQFLWKLCRDGIQKRYTADRLAKIKELFPDRDPMTIIEERLQWEMGVIAPKGMCDYLLIVWDFIHWAKTNGIPVGPGRGSGAGSIVLYLIGVTDIEPLRFHLFFERFINPERISYPDIDVDICMDQRGKVIQYTLQKYGKDNVAQIITFGTMKARMSIKDVGRVLSVPLARVNEIAKLVPEDLNITLDKALEKDHDLRAAYDQDAEVKRLLDLSRKLEGSIRSTGIHAAGLIISGAPLMDFIPICNAKDSDMPVTQYSMKPVEMVGMLKIDFLGLKTLTAIQSCVDAVEATTGVAIDWVNLPLDDKPTFDLLNQGKTLGVFQIESGGMQEVARQLHLDKFEEIIAVVALYRPGPMEMIPSFINRKHGREPIEYDHPWLKEILSETYGIMVYQEQVMQIASKLARYSLGEGDVLRRAMGKKDMDQMAQQRQKFLQGAHENGIDASVAGAIFDKMEKFAAYGFNKSHAAAYGYLSYVTAYMKANYPKEWMAALMTCDIADLTRVSEFIAECQTMGIPILSPDVNESGKVFSATAQAIRFGMMGIKGVGEGVVDAIIEERKKGGPFTTLYSFLKRIPSGRVGKRVIEHLIEAGCFDFTKWSRDALRQSLEPMYECASKEQKEKAQGIMDLFVRAGDTSEARFSNPPQVRHPQTKLALLLKEKELLGFFLTGHPMDEYRSVLTRLSCVPLSEVKEMDDGSVFRAAFLVETVVVRVANKTQRKFAILTIGDGGDRFELPIWSDLYEEKSVLLAENRLLYAVLQTERKEGDLRLVCRWFDDLSRADEKMIEDCDRAYDRAKFQSGKIQKNRAPKAKKEESVSSPRSEPKPAAPSKPLPIKVDANSIKFSHILQLKELFERHRGTTPIHLDFHVEQRVLATIHIDSRWGVRPSDEFHSELKQMPFLLKSE